MRCGRRGSTSDGRPQAVASLCNRLRDERKAVFVAWREKRGRNPSPGVARRLLETGSTTTAARSFCQTQLTRPFHQVSTFITLQNGTACSVRVEGPHNGGLSSSTSPSSLAFSSLWRLTSSTDHRRSFRQKQSSRANARVPMAPSSCLSPSPPARVKARSLPSRSPVRPDLLVLYSSNLSLGGTTVTSIPPYFVVSPCSNRDRYPYMPRGRVCRRSFLSPRLPMPARDVSGSRCHADTRRVCCRRQPAGRPPPFPPPPPRPHPLQSNTGNAKHVRQGPSPMRWMPPAARRSGRARPGFTSWCPRRRPAIASVAHATGSQAFRTGWTSPRASPSPSVAITRSRGQRRLQTPSAPSVPLTLTLGPVIAHA